MQVSQEAENKHGIGQAACESNADEFEMENVVLGRALMAEG